MIIHMNQDFLNTDGNLVAADIGVFVFAKFGFDPAGER
jgi:hypothetical protein